MKILNRLKAKHKIKTLVPVLDEIKEVRESIDWQPADLPVVTKADLHFHCFNLRQQIKQLVKAIASAQPSFV